MGGRILCQGSSQGLTFSSIINRHDPLPLAMGIDE